MADALSRDEIDALLRGMADGDVALAAEDSPRDVAQAVSLVADRDESPRRRFPALTLVHERFARELGKVLRTPAAVKLLEGQGVDPEPTSPEALGVYMKREYDTWGKVVRQANIKAE